MARVFLLFALLGALSISAAEVLTAGPRIGIGDPEIVPWYSPLHRDPVVATDGDEVVIVWAANRANTGGSLYALRLDREGRPLTKQPTLLVEGRRGSGVNSAGSSLGVIWTDGLYAIFYGDTRSRLTSIRVTRELEIVDQRAFGMTISRYFDVTRSGSEIVVADDTSVLRLGLDLTVRASLHYPPPPSTPRSVTSSPRGTVVVTGGTPALTAGYLDAPEGAVRIGSVSGDHSSQIEWTGSEFVVVWMDCDSLSYCDVQMARLDLDLHVLASSKLDFVYCRICEDAVGLTPLGGDEVLITWRRQYDTWIRSTQAQRFRKGVALDPKPIRLAGQTVGLRTALGSLLAVDGKLRIGELPPAGGDATSFSAAPVAELPATQRPLATGRSNREIAVAWNNAQKTFATILTLDGTPSRTIPLRNSRMASIASDGHHLYALTTDIGFPYFQKLSDGSKAVLALVEPRIFAWIDTGFLVVLRGRYDYEREHALPPALALLDRRGNVREGCRSSNEVTATFEAIVRGRDETLAVGKGTLMRLRGGCPGPVENEPLIPLEPKIAWDDGKWASLFDDGEPRRLRIAVAREGGRFVANPRPLFARFSQHWVSAVAGAGGRWIVLSKAGGSDQADELHAAVLDADGNVLSRTILGPAANGIPYLVPVSDTQVLAVYAELDFAPPWLGEQRLVARTLTIEDASRRRGVRH